MCCKMKMVVGFHWNGWKREKKNCEPLRKPHFNLRIKEIRMNPKIVCMSSERRAQYLLIKMKHSTANIVSCMIILPIIMLIIPNANRLHWMQTPFKNKYVHIFRYLQRTETETNCIGWKFYLQYTLNCNRKLISISTPPAINCANQFALFLG